MKKKRKRSTKNSLVSRLRRKASHILKELRLDIQEGAHTVGRTAAAVAKEIGPETKKVAQAARDGVTMGIEMVQGSYQGAVSGASCSLQRVKRRISRRK